MKLVGITQRIDVIESYGEIREALDIKWHELLIQSGFTPLILSATVSPELYFEKFSLSGILLTGGNDLASVNDTKENKMRDSFEKGLIDIAINKDIPLIGVCRGMQVIGEYFGCSLKKCSGHVATRHEVSIDKESRLYSIEGHDSLDVNSYHNYVIEDVEESDLFISAHSLDGSVEAVEHEYFKVFAHMWHPEREKSFCSKDVSYINMISD